MLLDVGVETTLKVFLSLPGRQNGKRVERVNFPSLLQAVWEVAGDNLRDIDQNQVEYYHRVRNKLYHQGDGVIPTKRNLEEYARIAKQLLKILLEVDLEDNKNSWEVSWEEAMREIELLGRIDEAKEALKSILEEIRIATAVAVALVRPEWVKKSFRGKVLAIWEKYPDDAGAPHWQRTENQDKRYELFNDLLQQPKPIGDYEFIDKAVQDVTYLYLVGVLRKMGWDVKDGVTQYEVALELMRKADELRRENTFTVEMEEKVTKLEEEVESIALWNKKFQSAIESTFFESKGL